MPIWLSALLLRAGAQILPALIHWALPYIITWLQKHGYISAATALLAKGATWTVDEVKSIKTYPTYDDNNAELKNNPFGAPPAQ